MRYLKDEPDSTVRKLAASIVNHAVPDAKKGDREAQEFISRMLGRYGEILGVSPTRRSHVLPG